MLQSDALEALNPAQRKAAERAYLPWLVITT